MLIKSMLNANAFDIAREMDRLFETMMAPQAAGFAPATRSRMSFPALNIWEDDRNLRVEAELPGMSMDDLEILATDSELTLKGERQIPAPENARTLRRERGIGAFERTITLPVSIDVEQVEARLINGVLTITLPKAPAHQPRRIEVKAAKPAS